MQLLIKVPSLEERASQMSSQSDLKRQSIRSFWRRPPQQEQEPVQDEQRTCDTRSIPDLIGYDEV